jgi:hypothetical protein
MVRAVHRPELRWLVPIRAVASKVTRIGGQLVSLAGGVHYWAESPGSGPEGWGVRLTVTLAVPEVSEATHGRYHTNLSKP